MVGRIPAVERKVNMYTVVLSEAEHQLLVDLLTRQRREFLHELHHTDDRPYRQALKEQEGTVEELLKKLTVNSSVGKPS
jgi:hypothetical protein